jgi:hypothetical protein
MFWTWIWGPLGLVLAVPLTVVMAVLGEHVSSLEPLSILLSDKPPLANHISYYQRLLAGDTDEGYEILEAEAKTSSPIEAYDSVIIPALILAERDRSSGELGEAEQQAIWQTTRELMDELVPEYSAMDDAALDSPPSIKARVIGCPAHDMADEMVLVTFKQMITVAAGARFDVLTATMLVAEVVARIDEERPDVVCISSVGPLGIRQTHYLCLRLRRALPNVRIVIGRWGCTNDRDKVINSFKKRGADQVVFSLVEGRDYLQRLTPLVATDEKASALSGA